jgi:hypothetical protein
MMLPRLYGSRHRSAAQQCYRRKPRVAAEPLGLPNQWTSNRCAGRATKSCNEADTSSPSTRFSNRMAS